MVKNIAVFASGSGSNFQAIIDNIENNNIKNAKINLLVCDKSDAYAIERAKKHNIPYFLFNPKNYKNKNEFETEILKNLKEKNIDFIALAGYMRLIGDVLLENYEGKMINLHPSILPAFKGKDAIKMALDYGVKYTGISIHWVDNGMDTGKIIAQDVVKVLETDDYASLAEKIHKLEHNLYPKVINELVNK